MNRVFNRVSVIGLGYIGLPTAAAFASRKINVIGVDVNQETVDTINRGEIHIVEPELDMIVSAAVSQGFLKATKVPEPADAFLIAVPTPFVGDEHQPNLDYIKAASKSISSVLKRGDLVILESTSPVGTTEKMMEWISAERPDLSFPSDDCLEPDINVAYCPERVLPGHVVRELVENDRVIGGMTSTCSEQAIKLYKIFVEGECFVTNARTAEMTKLTENASRDVSIAFANELSIICDELEIDVWELIELANKHPRVNVLQPGPGVGGHCIAIDPWFIISKSPQTARLITQARIINDSKPEWVVKKVIQKAQQFLLENPQQSISELTIALYGLAFKANIDDLRESPAVEIANKLQIELPQTTIFAVEPNIDSLPKALEYLELVPFNLACSQSDIHVLLVDHKIFRENIRAIPNNYLVDTKGLARRS